MNPMAIIMRVLGCAGWHKNCSWLASWIVRVTGCEIIKKAVDYLPAVRGLVSILLPLCRAIHRSRTPTGHSRREPTTIAPSASFGSTRSNSYQRVRETPIYLAAAVLLRAAGWGRLVRRSTMRTATRSTSSLLNLISKSAMKVPATESVKHW